MTVRLEAGAGTVHWGYLDATLAPATTIDSGDTVTISTVSGPPEVLPPPPAAIPQALYDIHNAKTRRMLPGHMCTGPVAVRGARPGQVLQVEPTAIVAFDDSVSCAAETETAPGEGLPLATMTGPGRVVIQSMAAGRMRRGALEPEPNRVPELSLA